jgi:hypothetical protein
MALSLLKRGRRPFIVDAASLAPVLDFREPALRALPLEFIVRAGHH